MKSFYSGDYLSPIVWIEPPKVLDLQQSRVLSAQKTFEIGRYDENRTEIYQAELFREKSRTLHVGVDLGAPALTPVFAPFELRFLASRIVEEVGDYGCSLLFAVVCERVKVQLGLKRDQDLFALMGHLAHASARLHPDPDRSEIGIGAGQLVGWLGAREENGGWPPHLHFQFSLEKPQQADLPGAVNPRERESALKLYPDPSFLVSAFIDSQD